MNFSPTSSSSSYDECIMTVLEELGTHEPGKEGNFKPLQALTKLPVNRIFVIKDVQIRRKGVNNSKFDAVLLETNDFATAVPKRIRDKLFKEPDAISVFKRNKLFKFCGTDKCSTTSHIFAKISFPRFTRPHGCLCKYGQCSRCDNLCTPVLKGETLHQPNFCLCWGEKFDIDNITEFQNAAMDYHRELQKLEGEGKSYTANFYVENKSEVKSIE